MAYAVAYVLYKKHNAKIAAIGELENVFYVDFEAKNIISLADFKTIEKEIMEFIYNRSTTVEIKNKPVAKVLACSCTKKNKYLSH